MNQGPFQNFIVKMAQERLDKFNSLSSVMVYISFLDIFGKGMTYITVLVISRLHDETKEAIFSD